MPRLGRSFLVFEALGALATVALCTRLPQGELVPRDVAFFFAVALLLTLFDLWLPHGDSVDIAAPLAIGATFALGPLPAMGVAIAARVVAHGARYRSEGSEQLLHLLARRVISLGAGAYVWTWLSDHPVSSGMGIGTLIVAASAVVITDAILLQAYAASRQRQSMGRLFLGGLRLQGLMWGAYVSVGVLTAILYPQMSIWGLLLMMGLLVVMRQSFSLLLDIRQAYEATMGALAAALEAHDPRRQGHAERVAALSRSIGVELGIYGRDLERLGYAALLHDVDLIGTEDSGDATPPSRASEVLADVGFLVDVMPVLALCDGKPASSGAGAAHDRLLAYIVCRASNMDELIRHERAAVRVYPPELMEGVLPSDQRERVEKAVWHLLTPGARLGS